MDWNNINRDRDTSGLGPIEYDQSKVPAFIRKHADNVRTKTYGQEVREAQARNAEYAGLIASEAENKANNADLLSKDTQNRFNDQIAGNTDINEVIDARRPAYAENTYATLGERLNAENDILKTLVATQVERTSDVYYLADYPLMAPEFGDSARIQRALDEMAENGGGTLSLPSSKNINIDSEILVRSSTNIVGNKSRFTVTGNLTNAITVNGSNVTLAGFDINKAKDNTTSTAIKLIGIRHLVTNISSSDSKWSVFIKGEKLKESHFSYIRVDNDVTGLTGTIFQFDYSVNNTLTSSMFGYSNMGIYLSTATDPTYGNKCEGLLTDSNIIVKTNRAVTGDWATFITVTNSILDFCSTCGVEITNGHSNIVSGTWINLTQAGFAIVFTQNSTSNKALGNTIVGVPSVSGQSAFSIGAQNSIVENNNISKMDGGTTVAGVFTRNNIVTGGNAVSDNPVVKETVQKGVSNVYFTRSNNIIEIEIWEQGTSNYLFAKGFKGTNNVDQHVLKTITSNGNLTLGAANAQGTQVINGYSTLANLVVRTKETRI